MLVSQREILALFFCTKKKMSGQVKNRLANKTKTSGVVRKSGA